MTETSLCDAQWNHHRCQKDAGHPGPHQQFTGRGGPGLAERSRLDDIVVHAANVAAQHTEAAIMRRNLGHTDGITK